MPLSDIQIRKLKPVEKQKKHADGNGLYLLQTPTGGKIWRMNFRFQEVNKTLSFGKYPEISLKDAREMCMAAREKLAKGIDPSVREEKGQSGSPSFREMGLEWYDNNKAK